MEWPAGKILGRNSIPVCFLPYPGPQEPRCVLANSLEVTAFSRPMFLAATDVLPATDLPVVPPVLAARSYSAFELAPGERTRHPAPCPLTVVPARP